MTRLGPFSIDTVVVGDCLDIMKQMPDGCVDLVVTSPPYNNYRNKRSGTGGKKPAWRTELRNIEYGQYDDAMPEDEYQKWQQEVVLEMLRITKPAGTVAYNHKNRIVNWRILSPIEWLLPVASIRQEIVWDRGSSPQISPVRFMPSTERIYLLGDGQPYFNGAHLADKEVWHIIPAEYLGIPSYPVSLVSRLIDALCPSTGIVADFYMGSGTTAVAARSLGRHFFGCDISPQYVAMARKRLGAVQVRLL